MIRSAEEFIKGYDEWVTNGVPFTISTMDAIKAINEARIEAIKECAEAAELLAYYKGDNGESIEPKNVGKEISDMGTSDYYSVDPKSILNLINQVK